MRTLGQNIGEETHILTEAEMPAHNHGGVTGTDYPDHSHAYGGYQFGASYGGDNTTFNPTTGNNGAYPTGGATARHQHSIPTDGGGAAHNVMQPSIALTYLIKY
jgi:microcystin-dependent protein